MNEQPVRGREAVFGAEFDASAGTNKLPADAVSYYTTCRRRPRRPARELRDLPGVPHHHRAGRAAQDPAVAQPVLAIGGEESSGAMVGDTMRLVADDVQTLVIPGCGHWVAEQAPRSYWRH